MNSGLENRLKNYWEEHGRDADELEMYIVFDSAINFTEFQTVQKYIKKNFPEKYEEFNSNEGKCLEWKWLQEEKESDDEVLAQQIAEVNSQSSCPSGECEIQLELFPEEKSLSRKFQPVDKDWFGSTYIYWIPKNYCSCH